MPNEWTKICAACAEGSPPERCAYYGEPGGCNAPKLGQHPDGNIAERLQEELEKAERRIAEMECAPGNTAALREALDRAECVLLVAARFATDNAFTDADARENLRGVDWDGALAEIDSALAAPPEPPPNAAKMRAAPEYAREILTLNGFVEPVVRCDAALAAPTRNCDRFATAEEAQEGGDHA